MMHVEALLRCGAVLTILLMSVFSVNAQSASEDSGLLLELNKTSPSSDGCLLTFVAQNKTGKDLSNASYEFVLFNKDGLVSQMTVFEFGALPPGKTVVRQFDLATLDCASVGRILINGPSGCSSSSPAAYCEASMTTVSRSSIDFLM